MYTKPIQHGELVLKPVAKLPRGKTKTVDSFIGSSSRAGHHHVLRSKGMTVVERKDHNFVQVSQEGQIVHLRTADKHPDLRLPVGVYQLNIKTEYDLFEDVIRAVED